MPNPSPNAKRILIADDDEFLTSMYTLSLQAPDRSIIVAHDGREAIDMMKDETFDLLILDLLMPKVDGYAVLAFVKEKKMTIPVIVLSNVQSEVDQKKCIELGAKDFYNKSSTDLEGLVAKVKKYV